MKLDRVLVPLDGSRLAEAAIETALGLTRGEASSILVLLRAAEAHTFPGADPTDEQVESVREAEAYLSGVVERLRRRGITEVESAVWYGPAAPAIIQAARVKKADSGAQSGGDLAAGSHGSRDRPRYVRRRLPQCPRHVGPALPGGRAYSDPRGVARARCPDGTPGRGP